MGLMCLVPELRSSCSHLLYPPQTKFGGLYRNHPSVRPSIRLSVRKFNKPLSRSCAYKVHAPFSFWTATIFLHAHLQVVYYKCVKFHKNPISHLGGVALTRYMDGQYIGYIWIRKETDVVTKEQFIITRWKTWWVWCVLCLNWGALAHTYYKKLQCSSIMVFYSLLEIGNF
jgi:hypothetical protein